VKTIPQSSETLLAHLDFLSRTFKTHGLPLALYVDFHSFFYTHNPDAFMITNDQELTVTQERIARFPGWLKQMRQTAWPDEFEAVASGYRLEIERMQAEEMEYLLHPPLAREVGFVTSPGIGP
jgi:hypothetical protein